MGVSDLASCRNLVRSASGIGIRPFFGQVAFFAIRLVGGELGQILLDARNRTNVRLLHVNIQWAPGLIAAEKAASANFFLNTTVSTGQFRLN